MVVSMGTHPAFQAASSICCFRWVWTSHQTPNQLRTADVCKYGSCNAMGLYELKHEWLKLLNSMRLNEVRQLPEQPGQQVQMHHVSHGS